MLFTDLFAHWGLNHSFAWFLSQFLSILIFDVVLLVMIAYLLLADRKVWAAVQMRRGPNVVGAFGLLQTFADLFKFLFKEVVIPAGANKVIFMIAPLISVTLAFAGWAVVPLDNHWVVADNIRFCRRSGLPPRWFPMKSPSALSSLPFFCSPVL
jgi:NADH-quinone oxidoreductase subunit H